MNRHHALLLLLSLLYPCLRLSAQEIVLKPGMTITQSGAIKPGLYRMDAKGDFLTSCHTDTIHAAITIKGNNIDLDFTGVEIRSTADPSRPDLFTGLAIRLQGKNIRIKNAKVRGFKLAVLAEGAAYVDLDHCDFSYNYRPKLRSVREHEDFADWLSYHDNEHDEWLRYGAGIYLKNCTGSKVRYCRISGNQNALLLTGCSLDTAYNNVFQYNSGLGIGLYRSSHNCIMHNQLDWNVRGSSLGFYQRGQDSAAILAFEQSSNNIFAFNSCTHSGDGFFLWAGQHTMDTGEGGCNDNLIYGNDLSYAPTNGVEVTFSRNVVQGNTIRGCTYGIWGGYSYNSRFMGNAIMACETAIAIEHGQNDTLQQNLIQGDSAGIRLWARAEQPKDWGYAQKRDTRNRDNIIDRNVFLHVPKPLYISRSENTMVNGENLFGDFTKLLDNPEPNKNLRFWRNEIFAPETQLEAVWANPELTAQRNLNFPKAAPIPESPYYPLDIPYDQLHEPANLPDALLSDLPADHLRGRQYILIDEWGPYDFNRPAAFLAATQPDSNARNIMILGPKRGFWRVDQLHNCELTGKVDGKFPDSLMVRPDSGAIDWSVQFLYTGPDSVTTEFGQRLGASTAQPFAFRINSFEQKLLWDLAWYNYSDAQDPLKHPAAFAQLLQQPPKAKEKQTMLYHAWWGSPAKGIQEDHFATVATSTFKVPPGIYHLELSSDDGVRLFLDGKQIIDHWDVHEPAVDEVDVQLGGQHTLRIEHFDAGGFATLDLRMKK